MLTVEHQINSFAEAFAWRITKYCFTRLDAPVEVLGAMSLPAVPMNVGLEAAMLPTPDKVVAVLGNLLNA